MKTLEVRCYCKPEKMLGWVEVPDHLAQRGRTLVSRKVEADLPAPVGPYDAPAALNSVQTVVTFPLEMFHPSPLADPYLAVKAEGYEGDELYRLLRPWNFRPADPEGWDANGSPVVT